MDAELESRILSREIGRLVGPVIGIGARWAARRLPCVASERSYATVVPTHALIAASLQVLRDLETRRVKVPAAENEGEMVSLIGSGIKNMNPTLIRVAIVDKSPGSSLRIRAVAKEGAVHQSSAELALERFIAALSAKLPDSAVRLMYEDAST